MHSKLTSRPKNTDKYFNFVSKLVEICWNDKFTGVDSSFRNLITQTDYKLPVVRRK